MTTTAKTHTTVLALMEAPPRRCIIGRARTPGRPLTLSAVPGQAQDPPNEDERLTGEELAPLPGARAPVRCLATLRLFAPRLAVAVRVPGRGSAISPTD